MKESNTVLKKLFLLALATTLIVNSNVSAQTRDDRASHIDSTISPGNEFFMFANNTWFKANPIPATESSYGIFKVIQDTINNQIRSICESASALKDKPNGSNEQKIGDFYASGMNEAAIERIGLIPLQRILERVSIAKDMQEILNISADLRGFGVSSIFSLYVGKDDKISNKNAMFLGQGGLGLPDRDYYLNNDERTVTIRNSYISHLQKINKLMGAYEGDAKNFSEAVMKIETQLATVSRKLEELRDPVQNYNKMHMAELMKLTPAIPWSNMFATIRLKQVDTVIVGQPEFFTGLNKLVETIKIDDWKLYIKWNIVNSYAEYINKNFSDQNFEFYYRTMNGVEEQKPRWKLVVEQTDGLLGELIGQIYVRDYLPKGTKEKLMDIGADIKDVYVQHIKGLDWMSMETKEKALAKLDKITMKFGYPDKWKDMSSVSISKDNYVQNIMAINRWNFDYMINKFGKPVDRTEWGMQPQTYNAYYDPGNNEIVVPGCNIIVPGYERTLADDAILYSIIGGSTIGHEITHGFDDQGSQYDGDGNLNDWWTADDRKKFEAKTKLIVEQFDNYKVLDSLHLNGDATQGENIADLGGIVMGYEAFKKTTQYRENKKIAGLTPDQRFFLGYAFAWMMIPRDKALARQIKTDVHAPARFRVNGPLSNMPEFYNAFGINKGDNMYRDENVRVRIW
ncbi:MAG: M13 family metallopeptidase [Bacteroidetes bacterium]|nr:M13 family metallopeptidase [Bacteroidota bacterium]